MISEADAQRIAEEWISAWNRHDLEAIVDHYADDVVSISPLAVTRLGIPDGRIEGKEQLRNYFAGGLEVAKDLHFELQRVLIGVEGMAIYYVRESGRHVVDVMTLNDEGKAATARVLYS
jgi:ketosteroid isomerase-like protein